MATNDEAVRREKLGQALAQALLDYFNGDKAAAMKYVDEVAEKMIAEGRLSREKWEA
jgi:hypothetical protein